MSESKWNLRIGVVISVSLLLLADSAFGSGCVCRGISETELHITCDPNGKVTATEISNCSDFQNKVTHLSVTMNKTSERDGTLSIDEDAFVAFSNITSLTLSSLGLKSLHSLMFLFQLDLQHLDLSHNLLSEISDDLFIAQYDTLFSLNLSHNNLPSLPSDFFTRLVNLHTLDLSFNKFVSLPEAKPSNWPGKLHLRLSNNSFPPCWDINNKTGIIKQNSWWCNKYSSEIDGIYFEKVNFFCKNVKTIPNNTAVVWFSPRNTFYKSVNDTSTWLLFFPSHWDPSSVTVYDGLGTELSIDRMRPYFSGVWSCLTLQRKGNEIVFQVIDQVLVSCLSKIRTTYHWSLIVSAVCTLAMVLAGLLSALIRLLWLTRCFTQKVHVVAALSLHDLQYSPRLSEQRIKILRRAENAKLNAIDADTNTSISSCESVLPAWLPPHRQRSIDPFAHGGGPVTSDEETESMLDHRFNSSDDELAYEDEDTMSDDNRVKRRMDELTERLRRDMVKRVDHVKSRMKERRHTMEESTSKVMRSLKTGGVVAASKMRSGFHNSMETVKFKVKTVADFCGAGGTSLGQTVSVSTLDTDLDTQMTVERRIADVTAV